MTINDLPPIMEKFWFLRPRFGGPFRPLSPKADIVNFSEGWITDM